MQYLEVMGSWREVLFGPGNQEEIYTSLAYVVNHVNLLKGNVDFFKEMFLFQIEGRKQREKKRQKKKKIKKEYNFLTLILVSRWFP